MILLMYLTTLMHTYFLRYTYILRIAVNAQSTVPRGIFYLLNYVTKDRHAARGYQQDETLRRSQELFTPSCASPATHLAAIAFYL